MQDLYEGSEDDAALYVDGRLVAYGDRYDVISTALSYCGTRRIASDAFKLGGDDLADTTEEIREYEITRLDGPRQSELELRQEAARILALADELAQRKE